MHQPYSNLPTLMQCAGLALAGLALALTFGGAPIGLIGVLSLFSAGTALEIGGIYLEKSAKRKMTTPFTSTAPPPSPSVPPPSPSVPPDITKAMSEISAPTPDQTPPMKKGAKEFGLG